MNDLTCLTKNSTMLRDFNETHPNHTWSSFTSDGPPHMPTFKVYLYLNDTRFEGNGSSKKRAKINAIQQFMSFTLHNKDHNFSVLNNGIANKKRKNTDISIENSPLKKIMLETTSSVQAVTTQAVSSQGVTHQMSAVSILHELFCGQTFIFEHEMSHGILEAISVSVSGKKYIGYGKNKKEAKEIACRNALRELYNVNSVDAKFKDQIEMLRTDFEDAKTIDHFAYLTDVMYQKLQFDKPKNKEYSVIASIIKVINNDMNSAEVICLATGTKCLSGNYLSLSGESLHDCHAEILARRCLVRYFYNQLRDSAQNKPSIFIADNNSKFKLFENIQFHLYINTAPCGEARIFSFCDTENHPNRLNRGLLRSKIENGAGTVSVFGREVQTYDGVAQGERLVTMSCSDKLTRWNVLGLQGNLLTKFVEPIYLESISIGSVFNMTHMERTLYGRIEKTICNLPEEYKVHKPHLRGYSILPRRSGTQSLNCVNWIIDEGMELVEGKVGRTVDNKLSRLCKSVLAKEFVKLCCETNVLSTVTDEKKSIFYDSLKSTNTNYITAKQSLTLAFKFSNFGTWVQKPEELKTFEVDVSN